MKFVKQIVDWGLINYFWGYNSPKTNVEPICIYHYKTHNQHLYYLHIPWLPGHKLELKKKKDLTEHSINKQALYTQNSTHVALLNPKWKCIVWRVCALAFI